MRRADPTLLSSRAGWRDLPVLRVFDALGRERVLRLSAAIALVVGMVWVVGNAMPLSSDVTTWIHDSANYCAAGERLNAGHSLYAYGPGDRQTLELLFGLPSPYLYPPLIGVLFRPIAAFLPYAPVVIAFWLTGMVTFLAFLGWLLYRGGTTIAVGILILLVPLVETAWSGNVSTFITMAIILAWFGLGSGHPRVAGAIIGFTSVLKLTPVFLAWWLLVTRRWDALTTAVVVGLVSLGIGLVGAGISAHLEYLHISDAVARGGGIQGSIVGVLTALGASPDLMPLVAPIASVIGIVAIWFLRKRERAAWVVAIATGVFASPIFNLTNVTLLLAVFVALDGRIGMGWGTARETAVTERPSPVPAA